MLSGVFQLDRGIFSNPIWNNTAELRTFIYILGNAVWREEGVTKGGVFIGRGQYLRSYRNLREDLMYVENNAIKHYSLSHLKSIIDKLVEDGRLQKESTKLGTLFTVVNYSKYQGFARFKEGSTEQPKNGERTVEKKGLKENEVKANTNKYKPKEGHIEIFDYWVSKNIIKHQKITQQMSKAMDKVLKEHSIESVKGSIGVYAEAYHSDYFYEYKHGLEEFLKQKNCLPDWIPGGSKYENYMDFKNKSKKSSNFKPTDGSIQQKKKPKMIFRDL